jgi:Bifunctional DNA primase/polymerase, N-terminal
METWRDAFGTGLRAEAVGFARHGWPVVPGSYPRGARWVGRPCSVRTGRGYHGAIPVHADWARLAGCGPERVAELWSGHPFSVLLATGMGIDALEVPAGLGRATAIGLRVAGIPVPIAATPTGRWLFPVMGLVGCIASSLSIPKWCCTLRAAGYRCRRHRGCRVWCIGGLSLRCAAGSCPG